jgi:hypothetical protein
MEMPTATLSAKETTKRKATQRTTTKATTMATQTTKLMANCLPSDL